MYTASVVVVVLKAPPMPSCLIFAFVRFCCFITLTYYYTSLTNHYSVTTTGNCYLKLQFILQPTTAAFVSSRYTNIFIGYHRLRIKNTVSERTKKKEKGKTSLVDKAPQTQHQQQQQSDRTLFERKEEKKKITAKPLATLVSSQPSVQT